MKVNDALHFIAGSMILFSLFLAVTYTQNWLWFTTFIGINLIQSSFTGWCLMVSILKKLGFKEDVNESSV